MATYYVATTGNDTTGNGSIGNPWATIDKARVSSGNGDTISIASGTYAMQTMSFTENRNIIGADLVRGIPTTILDGGGSNYQWRTTTTNSIINISNIYFKNNIWTTVPVGGIFCIATQISPDRNLYLNFSNCWFENVGYAPSFNKGIFVSGQNEMFGKLNYTFHLCVFKNILGDTSSSRMFVGQGSGSGDSRLTAEITNCIFYQDISPSVCALFASSGNYTFLNIKNTSFYSANASWSLGTWNANQVASYCSYYQTTGGSFTNSINADPLFIDAPNGDFHLRPTSPCRGTGTLT